MPNQQPTITAATPNRHGLPRRFAASAAAVLAFIIDPQERFLLLRHPQREGWEVVNGAIDAAETVLDAVLRETREEAGRIAVRPLGTIHAYTYRYDDHVQYMHVIAYLLAYGGGAVVPGDDMSGSDVCWLDAAAIESGAVPLTVPDGQAWLFSRALGLYRLWKDAAPPLQPLMGPATQNKHVRGNDAE